MKTACWHGILKILEITHLGCDGQVLWRDENIHNLLHQDGEEFLLRAAFTGGPISTIIPDQYYLGLDNRQVIAVDNTLDDLIGEPSITNGYARQSINSTGDFSINFQNDHYVAASPIVAFRCTNGSWGPVVNLFLGTSESNDGYLISTAVLSVAFEVTQGQSVTMRIGMQLRECA